MTPVGFKPTISEGERPQTYALDRAATGTGNYNMYSGKITKAKVSLLNKDVWGNIG